MDQALATKRAGLKRSPKLLKAITASPFIRQPLVVALALYIRFVHATSRWTVINDELPHALWDAGKPLIGAFWHGRLAMMPYGWRTKIPLNMLISQHRDGSVITDVIAHFGLRSVRGSSGDKTKGGVQAMLSMAKLAASGQGLAITPDGPRGPRMRANAGVIALARLTGLPVFPISVATSNRRILDTWDRFIVPLPFSRGIFVIGNPISVPRNADAAQIEKARKLIEDELNRVTAESDRLVGAEPIAPEQQP
jgi:lysophospholipid acyltransferase (LPLAT)-like uncharacterized protein